MIGLARGTPPRYVRTIPAVEAWALAMAVDRIVVETSLIFTDCKAVRALARAGKRRATSARHVNARVWNVVFTRTDGTAPVVEWMPAHLGREQVGVAKIGDGTVMTQEQWEMNGLVDEHAKVAAQSGGGSLRKKWGRGVSGVVEEGGGDGWVDRSGDVRSQQWERGAVSGRRRGKATGVAWG